MCAFKMGPSSWKEKWAHSPLPDPEAIFNWQLLQMKSHWGNTLFLRIGHMSSSETNSGASLESPCFKMSWQGLSFFFFHFISFLIYFCFSLFLPYRFSSSICGFQFGVLMGFLSVWMGFCVYICFSCFFLVSFPSVCLLWFLSFILLLFLRSLFVF